MEYKVGDRIIFKCKYINTINGSGNYTYGISYKILKIDSKIYMSYNNSYDKDDFDPTKHEYYGFYDKNFIKGDTDENIWDYFYTKLESRKFKLKKLNELLKV